MAQLRDPIVGRNHELEQLRSAVERAKATGSVIVVKIHGEAGIGKTTLLDYLADEACGQGFTCLRATGSKAERDFAFAGLTTLLDDQLGSDIERTRLDAFSLNDLAAVLPGLRSKIPGYADTTRDDPIDPLMICHSSRLALMDLADRSGGLVILVDDLQWMDEMTAAVISYWIRHEMAGPIVIALAQRPADTSIDFEHASNSAMRAADATQARNQSLELKPIADKDAAILLSDIPAEMRESLLMISGGNPFFITALAAHAHASEQSEPLPDIGEPAAYPPVVSRAILDELAEQPLPAQRLAWAAAVLGDPFDARLAGQVGELDNDETLRCIDTLADASLVIPVNRHGLFRFRHPILSSVIYDSIKSGWRIAAHERAAHLLQAAGADPLLIAGQLERCAAVGDRGAVDILEAAAIGARGLAPHTALRLMDSAIRLLPPSADWVSERRPYLMAQRADILAGTGSFDAARTELVETLRLAPPENRIIHAYLIANLVRVEKWLGRQSIGLDEMRSMVSQLPEGNSFERMLLEGLLLHELAVCGELDEMRQLGDSIATRVAGQPDQLFSIAAIRAFGEAMGGSTELATMQIKAATELLEGLTDDQLMPGLELLILLSSAEDLLGCLDDALRHAQRGIELATKSKNLTVGFWLRVVVGSSSTKLGDLQSAVTMAAEAEQLARMMNHPGLLSMALAGRSTQAALGGNLSAAAALAEESEAYLELTRDSYLRTLVACSLAPALLALAQPERCAGLLISEAGGTELTELAKPSRSSILEFLVQADLARGDIARAQEWAARAMADADAAGLPMSACAAHRSAAAVSLAAEQVTEAMAQAQLAIAAAEVAGAPIETARCQHLAGQAMASAGDKDAAIALLRTALSTFRDCDAAGLAAPVLRDLRALGVRTSGKRTARGSTGLDALSTRERVVADLVADGLTNSQIAARLYLSRRTVESHLVRIFSKLDVKSRTEVAFAVKRKRITAASREG